MLCKSYNNKNLYIGLIIIGVVSMILGSILVNLVGENSDNLSMMAGMVTGIGGAFSAIGIIRLIKYKKSSPEKLKAAEIELKDERNVQILRATYTVVAVASIIMFAVMAFIFLLLDYMVPAWFAICGIYADVVVFFIAYKVIDAKM